MPIEEQIYSLLRSRRYNRGKPYLPKDIHFLIKNAVKKSKPIELVGFWGVGPKSKSDSNDELACKFLNDLNLEIRNLYPPGLNFTFIFADMHGLHNGYKKTVIQSYIKSVNQIFKKYGFKSIFLSDLWKKYGISFDLIRQKQLGQNKNWWSLVENNEVIERNAKNRNIHLNHIEAAQKYFVMRDLEKSILESEFPNSIFHAFSDPKLKNVLPDMPTLYFYAKPGWSDTPWFSKS